MKPEKKFFVLRGVRQDTQTWEVEEGYWLCRTDGKDRTHKVYFYRDEKEAKKECEEYRGGYKHAIKYIKEGDKVWFIKEQHLQFREVIDIIAIGYDMYYVLEGTTDFYKNDMLFRSKEKLLEYLDRHINE